MFEFIANTRQRRPEMMDAPGADPRELRRSLGYIRLVNRYLGYTRAVIHHLKIFSRHWRKGQRIEIVDLATGSADIPRAILKWARQRGFDVRIVGLDRHPVTARAAAEQASRDSQLRIVQGDVFAVPFAEGGFDYALCAMFLHHLDEPDIVRVLRTMDRLARRGIIASDLLRHRRAYLWIKVLSLPSTAMVRHDAPASVAQALIKDEVLAIAREAGVEYARYYRHFGHRFVLAGEK